MQDLTKAEMDYMLIAALEELDEAPSPLEIYGEVFAAFGEDSVTSEAFNAAFARLTRSGIIIKENNVYSISAKFTDFSPHGEQWSTDGSELEVFYPGYFDGIDEIPAAVTEEDTYVFTQMPEKEVKKPRELSPKAKMTVGIILFVLAAAVIIANLLTLADGDIDRIVVLAAAGLAFAGAGIYLIVTSSVAIYRKKRQDDEAAGKRFYRKK